MSLPVTSKFLAAAQGDVNAPLSQVQLVLGNYANAALGTTAASSGDDGSGNYPAAGAIDGDRTELNVGAAAGADNDTGKSSWRSSGVPDNGDTVTLDLTFSQARTMNRIKLYHLSGHGLKTYKLSWWTGAAWTDFAATSDIVAAGQTSIATTGQLDTIDFSDVTSTKIRVTVLHTAVATDKANVVEIEAYRKIDITSRVKGISIQRQRDYKLANPLASTISLQCINDDRFFSVSHTPTAAETVAGYVNAELQPNMGILISLGFNYLSGQPETVQVFAGGIDRITVKPRSRDVVLEGRDGMKALVNKIDSTKLKSSSDITTCVQYVLNRANVSNYEMKLDTTSIVLDYFFTESTDCLSMIRALAEAAGDSIFYMDENGIATFRFFTTSTAQSHLYTSQSDFEAGSLTCIATKDGTNSLSVPVLFAPTLAGGTVGGGAHIAGGRLENSVGESVAGSGYSAGALNIPASVHKVNSVSVRIVPPVSGTISQVSLPWQMNFTGATAVTRISLYSESNSGGFNHPGSEQAFVKSSQPGGGTWNLPAVSTSWAVTGGTAYWLVFEEDTDSGANCTFSVQKMNVASGSWTGGGYAYARYRNFGYGCTGVPGTTSDWQPVEDSFSVGPIGTSSGSYTMADTSGTWTSGVYDSLSGATGTTAHLIGTGTYPANTDATVYLDGSDDGTTWTVTYSQNKPSGSYAKVIANHRYWRLRWAVSTLNGLATPAVDAPSFYFVATGTWISPSLDTGVNTNTFGILTATRFLNGGSVNYLTASSDDNLSWDAWVAVSGTGQIQSTVRRYLKLQVDPTLTGDFTASPQILDITVRWTSGTASTKYPPAPATFTFSFDSTLLDVQQELADNLSGDSSILNDVRVQAQPLILTGNDSDTVWQGTLGTPPSNIAGPTPLSVTIGQTLFFAPVVSGGMDTSHMAGANPAAAVVHFASGSGTWSFSSIHPTLPILKVVITGTGAIDDLRIVGKRFSNANYLQVQEVQDAVSIAKYGQRQLSLSNNFIVGTGVAGTIAALLLANFKNPVAYIPACKVRANFAAQIGDRVTVKDQNTDLSADYVIVGLAHNFSVDDVSTDLTLLQVPAGS